MTIGIEHVNDYPLILFEVRFERKFPIRRSLDISMCIWATVSPISTLVHQLLLFSANGTGNGYGYQHSTGYEEAC